MSNGDAEFTAYATANRTRCRRTAYLLCGDWSLAEDIAQQSMIKLYLAWGRVRADGADGYVRRIISRTAIDEWRRRSRRQTTSDDVLVDVADPRSPVGYEERSALIDALQQLPVRQRQVVVLRHWWGCSVAEVARDLRISTGTVKSQTARALERLNLILSEPQYAPDFSSERIARP